MHLNIKLCNLFDEYYETEMNFIENYYFTNNFRKKTGFFMYS